VNSIAWKMDTSTASTLNVQNAGIGTATSVFFEVRDSANMPVQGVEVTFGLGMNAAAGCAVAPTRAITDMMGVVRTTLSSGTSSGLTVVTATVVGLPPASTTGFNIRWGLPYHERLQVTCDRKTIGALQSASPPRVDNMAAICSITLQDRDGNAPNYPVTVNWKSEAGSINGMPSMANNSTVTAVYGTGGSLPVLTTPLAGEPFSGTNNPRDAFVTVIASVGGEETFYDGSGSTNGVTNGQWDPGEYFVDLPEPFVDRNDNGVFDIGEPFTDTERFDCATGQSLGTNSVWDGPNGCWDKKTQIWGVTHIVYAGSLTGGTVGSGHVTASPALPTFLPVMWSSTHSIGMSDSNFNRLSSDGIQAMITSTGSSRCTATVSTAPSGGESFGGHSILYTVIKATETSPGVFRDDGLCDYASGLDAGYPATRCLPAVKFNGWNSAPTAMGITINGASSPQTALPDGGTPPPQTTSFELRVSNTLQAGPSIVPFTVSCE
jgi:hypothetical protein